MIAWRCSNLPASQTASNPRAVQDFRTDRAPRTSTMTSSTPNTLSCIPINKLHLSVPVKALYLHIYSPSALGASPFFISAPTRHTAGKSMDKDLAAGREHQPIKPVETMAIHFLFTRDLSISIDTPKVKFIVMRCRRKVNIVHPRAGEWRQFSTEQHDQNADLKQTMMRLHDFPPKVHRQPRADTTNSEPRRLVFKVRTPAKHTETCSTANKDKPEQSESLPGLMDYTDSTDLPRQT